jgi:hypothetical protein
MSAFEDLKKTLYAGISENFGDSEADDPSYSLDWLTWTALKAVPQAITTEDEARETAIDWQTWQSEVSLSYGELSEWQAFFETLAKQFNLNDEFKENGII